MSTPDLAVRFREQAEHCLSAGSPLTAAVLRGAADDLAVGGPVAELLRPHEADPPGSVPALRFAAALHRAVLERRAPLLATHYPSVGGTAPVEDVWPAVHATVVDQHVQLARDLHRPVQTNEVGRAAVLLGVLQLLAADDPRPVRLLELGASAGLNLLVDRVAVRTGGVVRGPADSPVRLHEPWTGALPVDAPVRVVERRGCDPAPVDPRSTAGRLTLTSCVWADQRERLERLRGALALAERVPAPVDALPASTFLRRELARTVPGTRTVVWHSVVRQYRAPAERDVVDALLEQAGARARADAPLAHVALEPDRAGGDRTRFLVTCRTWPGGVQRTLAHAAGHGPPVAWLPGGLGR